MGPFVGSYSQVLFVDDLGTELAGQQFGSVGAGLVEYLVVLAHPLVLRRRGRLGRRWGRLTGRSWSRLLGRPLDGLLGRPLDGLLAGLRGAAVDGGPDLQVGMALAIEPMATLGSADVGVLDDGWTVVTEDGRWASHWEHTVAITPSGPWVLTAVDEIRIPGEE